ncbi:DUF1496 domain-containing protein [Photobacterium sanctipauli]|uniref:DUF1496 domain-containing protein n=1 Tax=Photobacterium sanctipauli TaxID=1342794 RepID=A0A2T3NWD9_9GAMM|nr:DUF1496 domain-containing protein [Photobacterium sanctipauli]PSW20617.1 DUF1496 domain-containing protein [Photobacterium sanctipauli]
MVKFNTKQWGFICLAVLASASTPLVAKEYSVSSKPKVVVGGQLADQRVCYFDDKKYSLGAVIAVEGVLLECQPEKDFESNGRLSWHRVKA